MFLSKDFTGCQRGNQWQLNYGTMGRQEAQSIPASRPGITRVKTSNGEEIPGIGPRTVSLKNFWICRGVGSALLSWPPVSAKMFNNCFVNTVGGKWIQSKSPATLIDIALIFSNRALSS